MSRTDVFSAVRGPAPGELLLSGELDMTTAPLLSDAIAALGDRDVTLDLSGLDFVDAKGLGAFVRAANAQRARRRALVMINGTPRVRRTFATAHVTHLLSTPA